MIKATYNDKERVLEILTKSFDNNISVNYVIKPDRNDTIRRKRIRNLMEYAFEDCYRNGEVYLSDDRNGCALIIYPDKKKSNLQNIYQDLKITFSTVGITRILKILKRESTVKKCHPQIPLLYLRFIGVDPEHQSKGVGKSLVTEISHLGSKQNRQVILETSMVQNVTFYKKAGFELFQELELPHKLYLFKK